MSFTKQGGRAGVWHSARALQFLSELIAGQVALATPLIFLLCVAGIAHSARRAFVGRDPACTLLTALSVPPALVFVQHAFGDRVQANWPAIIYPAAAIAGAGLLNAFWVKLRAPAIALGAALTVAAYVQASAAPLSLPSRLDPTLRQLAGWPDLAAQVAQLAQATNADFVAADEYGLAAELARALPSSLPVLGIEPRWELFALPHVPLDGRAGLLIRSTRRKDDPDYGIAQQIKKIAMIARERAGNIAEEYRVFRIVGKQARGARLPSRPNFY